MMTGGWIVYILFFIGVFCSLCHQAPASTRQYELGTTYTYEYMTEILLYEAPAPWDNNNLNDDDAAQTSTVGYQVTADLQIAVVWQNPDDTNDKLIRLNLISPRLHVKSRKAPSPEGFLHHTSKLDTLANQPAYFQWNDGRIAAVYFDENDPLAIANVKRGAMALFQYETTNTDRQELSPGGECKVTYKAVDSRHFKKVKSGCKPQPSSIIFMHQNPIMGADLQSHYSSEYTLARDESVVEKAQTSETHTFRVTARQDAGGIAKSVQELSLKDNSANSFQVNANTLDSAVNSISTQNKVKLVRKSLLAEKEPYQCDGNCKNLASLVKELKDNLQPEDMATLKAASSFLKLVQKVRMSSRDEIEAILKQTQGQDIFPQLLDVMAAAQTADAHLSVKEVLSFRTAEIDLPERYLLTLSLATHPNEQVLKDLLKMSKVKLPSDKLRESVILTLTALTKTYSKNPANNKKVVQEIKTFIVEKLQSCEDEPCQHSYLRALKNLGLPETMPTLVRYVRTGEPKVAVTAMKALSSFPDDAFDDATKTALEQVFHQLRRKYDATARTLAVDVLLRTKPSEDVVRDVLLSFTGPRGTKEVNTYVVQRLLEAARKDQHVKNVVRNVLRDPRLCNYHTLAQTGMSSVFTRSFAETPSGNSTFTSAMAMAGGMLKYSAFDVLLENSNDSLRVMQYGLFAAGLSSFGSNKEAETGEDEKEPEEDATAGMEIQLMGTQLRPFVFFTGNGELMGHVWSGTGSERTTALQATVLLQDHKQYVPLDNGLTAELTLVGSTSFDFAGQIQISLWNRDARSLIENNAGFLVQGIVGVDTTFVKSQVEFNVAAEAGLHITSDLNFYSDVLMCIRLTQAEFPVKHNIHKIERIPGSKHRLRKSKYKSSTVQGRTYALNAKNSELCGVMFKNE